MTLAILLVLAAEASAPSDFDLARLRTSTRACRQAGDDQIVVCATKAKPDERVQVLGSTDEAILPRAEIGLFGDVKAAVENEAADVGGFRSNRVMVRLKVPF